MDHLHMCANAARVCASGSERRSFLACHNNGERRTHTHTPEKKKELPTGETVKHLLPLPHTGSCMGEGERAGERSYGVSYVGSMELLLKVVQLR